MKKKIFRIMGMSLAFVMVASMLVFAIPVSAGPYDKLDPAPVTNGWVGFTETEGGAPPGFWFYDPNIQVIGPMAEAIDGDLYAYVYYYTGTVYIHDIYMSSDGGRTWSTSTAPGAYPNLDTDPVTAGKQAPEAVVDIAVSSLFEDVVYVTDGNYVYKSIDGGMNWSFVAKDSLETALMGCCDDANPACDISDHPITCIDVGYNGSDEPIVFIGTNRTVSSPWGSVYWIADGSFGATWTNLDLSCYGYYDVYAVGCAPNFATSNKVYIAISRPTMLSFAAGSNATVTVTNTSAVNTARIVWTAPYPTLTAGTITDPNTGVNTYGAHTLGTSGTETFVANGALVPATKVGVSVTSGTVTFAVTSGSGATITGPSTQVVSTVGTVCSWSFVTELYWNCDGPPAPMNNFEISHASRFAFSTSYASNSLMFIGVVDANSIGLGGDVYRVSDTPSPADDIAIDLNVQGYISGCLGLYNSNICSLDIKAGDSLIAGAWDDWYQDPTQVYYSYDGGWTWAASKKDPTGVDRTYVLWYGDSALASTRWCDAAVSMSCGTTVGEFWNQISLINMDIDNTLDMSHAPGYLDGSTTMYVLTYDTDACVRGESQPAVSLLRWDGTYWERVFSSRSHEFFVPGAMIDNLMDWVEVSPDFNETGCLYLANTDFIMFRSMDEGCSWNLLTYPCEPRPQISAWTVVDSETVLAAGAYNKSASLNGKGKVYKTTYHGAQPWTSAMVPSVGPAAGTADDGVDFDLSPKIADDDTVLLGDMDGNVFISKNLGDTWDEISAAVGALGPMGSFYSKANTYVIFDPGYGTAGDPGQNMVYAASGHVIGRCDINSAAPWMKQSWVYINEDVCEASGIAAAGDTALYVADAGEPTGETGDYDISGTIGVIYTYITGPPPVTTTCDIDVDYDWGPGGMTFTHVSGIFVAGEPLEILSYDLQCLPHPSFEGTTVVNGEIVVQGYSSGAIGIIHISDIVWDCPDCVAHQAMIVISGVLVMNTVPSAPTACPTGVWRSLNPMDPMPPVSPVPTVEWEYLVLDGDSILQHNAPTDWTDDLWLTKGSNMLWALDKSSPHLTTIWMWNDTLATPVILKSPTDGTALVTSDSVTLTWNALDKATSYEVFLYSFCPACPEQMALVDGFPYETTTVQGTCLPVSGLTPGTTYYWKVRVAEGSPKYSKWSELWSFDTGLTGTWGCSPDCGEENISLTPNFSWDAVPGATGYEIEVATSEDFGTLIASGTPTINAWDGVPQLENGTTYYWRVRAVKDGVTGPWYNCLFSTIEKPVTPTTTTTTLEVTQSEITPMWIWVIIGIGAALVIAVIVLIVTTRRVA
jgi:hypothetical protein